MTERDDFFARLQGRLNLRRLGDRCVAIVGIGSVGSELAVHLCRNCAVGHLLLIDGDRLELHNLTRHALPSLYLGANKADAMADYLSSVPGIDVGALNRHIDDSISDRELDSLLAPADLIVIATDNRRAQRRVAERALALDIPAVIPGLYRDRGGEVFVQLGPAQPCLSCWDLFRPADSEVRAVAAASADALAVIQQTIYLCIALLDPQSPEARDLAPGREDQRPRQLFILQPTRRLVRLAVERRPDCPSCRVGPSPVDSHAIRASLLNNSQGVNALAVSTRGRSARDWEFRLRMPSRQPTIEQLTVSSPIVVEGATVVVRWATRNAAYVEIDGTGPFPTTGSTEFTVSAARYFRLAAHNPHGIATAVSKPIRVVPLPRPPTVALPPFSVAKGATTKGDAGATVRFAAEPFRWPLLQIPHFHFDWPTGARPTPTPRGRVATGPRDRERR